MYRYLIVDDEPMIRYSVCHMLKHSQFPIAQLYEAEDGTEAINILQKEQIHFILIDINMPKMNGLQLAEYVCEHARDSIMCIISGYDDFKYAQQAIRYGVRAYLLKPVNRRELYQTMEDMIAEQVKRQGLWISHERFSEYVDTMFRLIKTQDEAAVAQTAGMFLSEIAVGSFAAQMMIIGDLLNVLAGRVTEAIGEHLNLEMDAIRGYGEDREQWLLRGLTVLAGQLEIAARGASFRVVENARRYMERNGWNVSLDELAGELGINPSYFSRIFREESGETFVAYRTALRMKRAGELLENLEKPVSAVAQEVGYGDVTHFIRVFKKHKGKSPSEYRKRVRP